MNPMTLQAGDAVVICAKDEFYAFVDGWTGYFRGWNNGLAIVECPRKDGEKTIFVKPEELERAACVVS